MSIWQKMRYKMGLSASDMANKLNIDEEKYLEIERGQRSLPKEHVNKFLEIKNEQEMNEKEMEIFMIEVNNWLKNVNWSEIEREFGFKSHNDARKAIGIAFSTYALVRTDFEQVADKTRRKVYRFYHDELNKNVKGTKHKASKMVSPKLKLTGEDYQLVDEIDTKEFPNVKVNKDGSLDINYILTTLDMTQIELSNALGVHSSCISKWKIQKQLPRLGTLRRLNDILKSHQNFEYRLERPTEIVEEVVNIEETNDVEETCPDIEIVVPNCPEIETDVETTENSFQIDESISFDDDYVVQLESRVKALERTIACYEKLIERL